MAIDTSKCVVVLIHKSNGKVKDVIDGDTENPADTVDIDPDNGTPEPPKNVKHTGLLFWTKSNPICFYDGTTRRCI